MIRIANIIEDGRIAGPQKRIILIADKLKDRIDTLVVIPSRDSGKFIELCQLKNINFVTLPISHLTREIRGALRYFFWSFVEIANLTFFFRRTKYDLIHVSGGSWQFKGVIAGKLAGVKVIWHLNDTSSPKIIRWVFSFASPLADGYIFASDRSKKYYSPLIRANRPEIVVPAPVDSVYFDPTRVYSGDEELISTWENKFVVGTVANINPVKDLETFIRSAVALNESAGNYVFVVVGPVFRSQTKYSHLLHNLCQEHSLDNIQFVGARSDIRALLNRFDVYVCSSCAESSPISVWEAMAMAKPIVSTDVGDVSVYLKHNYSGYIVDVGDAPAIANRIRQLRDSRSQRHLYGIRARNTAVDRLSLSNCAELHMTAYESVLSQLPP